MRVAPGAARAARRRPALCSRAPPADARTSSRPGPAPTPIEHNCSGKHAGFLAVCRARGFETRGYRFAEHPLQRELLAEIAAAAGVAWRRAGRDRRLRCPDVRAARSSAAPTLFAALPRARRWDARRRRDARPAGAAAGACRGRCQAHSHAAGLGCEGWCRGVVLRRFCGRPGDRGEGRGRLVPRHSPCSCHMFSSHSGSIPAIWASSRWRTAMENASEW